jgi:hypothetical protein
MIVVFISWLDEIDDISSDEDRRGPDGALEDKGLEAGRQKARLVKIDDVEHSMISRGGKHEISSTQV